MFNGLKLEGVFLEVKKAKYQSRGGSGRFYQQKDEKQMNFVLKGRVWRPKKKIKQEKPDSEECNTIAMYRMDEEKSWIERCACATLYSV